MHIYEIYGKECGHENHKTKLRNYPEYEQVADFLAKELELREHQPRLLVFPHRFSVLTPR